ncbi:MAG: hypothetical protein KJN78_02885 [Gammaproteobacteria bacterium]|nr:hypothetical protein [Gammaproteobacteria bacterium]
MKIETQSILASLAAVGLLATGSAIAGDSADEKIARAMSAAPAAVSAKATIMDTDGAILREGDNGWTCIPDTLPGDHAPMCNDETWMQLMGAMMKQEPYQADRIGISYMMQGEPEGAGVSNATPYHPDPKSADDYVETGPHLMIVVPKHLLKGISDDPNVGGPYVMWGETPYAHIMIPVALEGKGVVTKKM